MKKLLMAGGAASLLLGSTAYASIIDRPFFKVLGVVVVWGADGVNGTNDAPVVSDFVLLTPASGAAGADLIGADGATVVTGTLDAIIDTDVNADGTVPAVNPVFGGADNGTFTDGGTTAGVLDASDTLTAFGVDAGSDVGAGMANTHQSSFYVASNAAFDIRAQSSAFVATGDFLTDGTLGMANISYDMDITVSGDDGLPFGSVAQNPGTTVPTGSDLSDYAVAAPVFQGTQRTAAARGTLAAQSVRFDNTYELDDGTGLGYDLSMGSGTVQADMVFTVYVP
ncbi:MAG: hypothetical protein EX271_06285 [Acidimicrobiales bacterium]|nr:hypothetical protein [Hyphomonadaceae bacterium]RZV42256.1 MAG: hypothetical protein EX271_06285 [Acidimicrobiales bacterium]